MICQGAAARLPEVDTMARYGSAHKAETRQRIIDAAGKRLKQDGIDGSGIATVMADAGLTNGAFYAHFESKSDLVAQVVTDQLARQRATIGALPTGRDALEGFIREYLSAAHRRDYAEGCPTAALLGEIGRCDAAVQNAYSEGAQAIIDEIATHLPLAGTKAEEHRTALALFNILVTSLQLARAIPDASVSVQVLNTGIQNALHVLDEHTRRSMPC